jgi:ribosomal-protein-alanine N-acetyltransferase
MTAILDCSLAESEELAKIHASCFEKGWSKEAFDQLLASPGAFGLLARIGGVNVGFVLARVAVDEAEILSIGVSGTARRRGVGLRILAAAAQRAGEGGAGKLFLEVGTDNAAALALYRKLGFREVGRRPGYYGEGAGDGLTMRAYLPLSRLGNESNLD